MVGLLLSIANGWCTDNQAIILFGGALALGESLTAAFGTTLIVGTSLGALRNIVEILGELHADHSQLLNGLVAEHAHIWPIDCTVLEQENFIKVGIHDTNPHQ